MTEDARIGRVPVYLWTVFIFMILLIPTALVRNIVGFCVLRFIAGIFAAAPIGIGPASICDALPMAYNPIGIAFWSAFAVSGPALGPLIGAILTVKAIILRKKTGNKNITSIGEVELKHMNAREVMIDTLWRPFEMIIKEPVILLIDTYNSMIYAIMYLWFEAFPIVFYETKNFTLVTMGVAYVCIFVGCILAVAVYIPWTLKNFTRPIQEGKTLSPEAFLPVTIFGAIMMPIGLFIFGWTSSPEIN